MNVQYIRDKEFIKSDKKYSIHGVDKREAKNRLDIIKN